MKPVDIPLVLASLDSPSKSSSSGGDGILASVSWVCFETGLHDRHYRSFSTHPKAYMVLGLDLIAALDPIPKLLGIGTGHGVTAAGLTKHVSNGSPLLFHCNCRTQ